MFSPRGIVFNFRHSERDRDFQKMSKYVRSENQIQNEKIYRVIKMMMCDSYLYIIKRFIVYSKTLLRTVKISTF